MGRIIAHPGIRQRTNGLNVSSSLKREGKREREGGRGRERGEREGKREGEIVICGIGLLQRSLDQLFDLCSTMAFSPLCSGGYAAQASVFTIKFHSFAIANPPKVFSNNEADTVSCVTQTLLFITWHTELATPLFRINSISASAAARCWFECLLPLIIIKLTLCIS